MCSSDLALAKAAGKTLPGKKTPAAKKAAGKTTQMAKPKTPRKTAAGKAPSAALAAVIGPEAVARTEDIEVTPEELGREVASIAASLGRDPKEVATSLDRSGQIVALAGDIIRSKALDILVEHATVTPEDPSGSAGIAGESRSEGAS